MGIGAMGVMHPQLVMRNIIPVVMAGVLGIYGLIVSVILLGSSELSFLCPFLSFPLLSFASAILLRSSERSPVFPFPPRVSHLARTNRAVPLFALSLLLLTPLSCQRYMPVRYSPARR